MTGKTRIVLSSDHTAIALRQVVAGHIAALGYEVLGIGPVSSESTPYPAHGEAAARKVATGECNLGIVLCGTGQGIMMAAKNDPKMTLTRAIARAIYNATPAEGDLLPCWSEEP